MQTITCTIKELATICADLTKNGIAFEAEPQGSLYFVITITGF
jgi:hypothetical protein